MTKNFILLIASLLLFGCASTDTGLSSAYDKQCVSRSGHPMTTPFPKAIVRADPNYPANYTKSAQVNFNFIVDSNGKPSNIKFTGEKPKAALKNEILSALKQYWIYGPACNQGKYIDDLKLQYVEVIIRFDEFGQVEYVQ